MKTNSFLIFFAALVFPFAVVAHGLEESIDITVTSTRDFFTDYEIVEISADNIVDKFVGVPFVISDSCGREVPYQVTFDSKLIFPVSVAAGTSVKYTISKGDTCGFDTLATGRMYPERQDDMAWENDKIGFRAYGPESQRRGDRLYGYDIFLKRDISSPVLQDWILLNQSQEISSRIDSLRRAGNTEEAKRLDRAKSYHIDHGHGMDCYAVGPTLGAATTAIIAADSIVYPWCFESCEVLDNGPLRFSVRLTFPKRHIAHDEVVEHRLISLDAGSHLNSTSVSYEGLHGRHQAITGIVMHPGSEQAFCDPATGYIAYSDPTQGSDNGEIYIGAVFSYKPSSADIAKHGDIRHVAAFHSIDGDSPFIYYWGAGWNRSDIPDWQSWLEYLKLYAARLHNPLQIKVH